VKSRDPPLHPVKRTALAALLLLLLPALGGCLDLIGPIGPVQPRDLITDQRYTEWVIEIDYVDGMRPSQSAINLLQQRLEEVARKDRITIVVDDNLGAGRSSWSLQEIQATRDTHQDSRTRGDTVVTYVLYLDGRFAGNAETLGLAAGHDLVVLFPERIRSAAFLTISATDIERAVLVHEFGHILGLVNHGIPMQTPHEDAQHPGHSSNRNSVMYWAVESTDIGNIFTGSVPTAFDANDKADLCAAGGRC
jgi:hypothetical protein